METQQLMKFGTIREVDNGVIELDGFHVDMNGTDEWVSISLLSLVIKRLEAELAELHQKKGGALERSRLAKETPMAWFDKAQGAVSFMIDGEHGDGWVPVIERPNV